jgi:hypothetical protein
MSTFQFASIHRALDIDRLFKQELDIQAQLAELDAVQEILATPAWTAVDVQRYSTLDLMVLDLSRRRLAGRERDVSVAFLDDSPFWFCVETAMIRLCNCLDFHRGIFARNPTVVMANTHTDIFGAVPGGDQQVHVAFLVVTLLYATFSVPVPQQGTTPLWPVLNTRDRSQPPITTPTFACLDLAARADGRLNDVYHLKPNLRRGVFIVRPPRPGQTWRLVPWLRVLRMLVGYTKYV